MGTTPGTGKQALSAHCLKAMEAHQLDQLSEARAEFAQFAGYMGMGKQGEQQGASAAKWAKGEAKGEPKQEPDFSSKGLGAASLTTPSREGQMVLGRRRRHAGPGSGKQTRSGGQRTGYGEAQGANWNRQSGYRNWPSRKDDRGNEKERVAQRDAFGVASLDGELMIFMQTAATRNQFSITSKLFEAATEWNRQKETDPSALTQPMRNMLLFCVFTALLNQVEALETDTQLMEQARTVGIMEGTTYLYIRWDAELRRHIRADQQPLEHAEAAQSLKVLKSLTAFPSVVGRFHALHTMTAEPASDIIPVSLMAQSLSSCMH